MRIETAAIIGAGPAGLATALQLKRHGIEPLLLERDAIGGLLRNANWVENYPGFPDGISGLDLARLLAIHARRAGIEVVYDEVQKLTFQDGVFQLTLPGGSAYSQVVVIATGTRPNEFVDIEIPEIVRMNVLYEVHPLLGVSGKRIAIAGAGDAAFDYALNLARRNEVMILNRGASRKCLPLLWERAMAQKNIVYHENMPVCGIERGRANVMRLLCKSQADVGPIECNYLIGAIGRVPRLDFLSEQVRSIIHDLEDKGLLYFVGDIRHGLFRQTAIAVGDGIRTGMIIYQRQKGQA
ncbi:MAG: NAD(P)/FAD-dependent oxidoreductase [Candidatus Latescibacterota bacterium]